MSEGIDEAGRNPVDSPVDNSAYNSVSGGRQHIVIQGRDFTGPITITAAPPDHHGAEARSAYAEQVRRIAPARLQDREEELRALSRFSRGQGPHPYAWWRAGPWAGKTALMSWFALHPPEGVRVVPFFVTARLGAQNDRGAFVDVVLEQLAEMAGETLPAQLSTGTREAHLLALLRRVGATCTERGERLVLLVDGLDEDRGTTSGADAHSIAGLLPRLVDDGGEEAHTAIRVVVAGRPNPPIPTDVPADHPLRITCDVHELSRSPVAAALHSSAEQELGGLFEERVPRDVLGLVTAAGGGLTAEDLAHLTDATPYEVRRMLRTSAGRTFEIRDAPFRPGPDVYLLAHEELHVRAEELLGAKELGRHRKRLHAWAGEYRERGWPGDTPGYLLRGYFALVRAGQDRVRVVALALDRARRARLFQATGGDVAALAEIRSAEEIVIEGGGEPLTDVLRLALSRHAIAERHAVIPAEVPLAWAVLGHHDRAVALALSSPRGRYRIPALVKVAEELHRQGQVPRAVALLDDVAGSLDRLGDDTDDLAEVLVRTWLSWGEFERAEELTARVGSSVYRISVLPTVVSALGAAGLTDRAKAFSRTVRDPVELAVCLLWMGASCAPSLSPGAAEVLVEEAADILHRSAHTLLDPPHDARLDHVVRAFVEARQHERALALADAHELCDHEDDYVTRSPKSAAAELRCRVALALAKAGSVDRALTLIDGLGDIAFDGRAVLACLTLVACGQYARTMELARTLSTDDIGSFGEYPGDIVVALAGPRASSISPTRSRRDSRARATPTCTAPRCADSSLRTASSLVPRPPHARSWARSRRTATSADSRPAWRPPVRRAALSPSSRRSSPPIPRPASSTTSATPCCLSASTSGPARSPTASPPLTPGPRGWRRSRVSRRTPGGRTRPRPSSARRSPATTTAVLWSRTWRVRRPSPKRSRRRATKNRHSPSCTASRNN
ncbi:hypothetical protein [Streptomyces sp. NPDC127108]|uniref:hypothetical protein n=1 Tax=Streptomyces sp. NPDC127108 TaxID=3345361 RepID=UPI003645ED8C